MDIKRNKIKSIKVGIIQMQSIPLELEKNLLHAGQLIEKVCKDGAQLVVLPELFNIGYSYSEECMSLAENLANGNTITWLKEHTKKYNIHIVTSIYEVDNGSYFNTMVMVTPSGKIQHYRKRNPFWQECTLYQQGEDSGPGIFDTDLGRIGGIICFDAFSKETYDNLKNNNIDMAVIVACWGIPRLSYEHPSLKYPKKMLEEFSYLATEVVPNRYARDLNIPVIHVGQGGLSFTPVPVPKYWPFSKAIKKCDGDFWGHSHIRMPDGMKVIEADAPEFVGVANIDVQVIERHPEIKCTKVEASYLSKKKYVVQPPSFMSKVTQEWCHLGFNQEYNTRRMNRT